MRRGYHNPPKKRSVPIYSTEQWEALIESAMATKGGITHARLSDDGPEVIPDPDITSVQ
jgi:hypothetical protein